MPELASSREDQARGLRRLVRAFSSALDRTPARCKAGATTIAVAGGKGGVGKTNVAVNLGLCLATRGHRVTLLDLDMGMADADVMLGVQAPYNLAHVLSGLRSLEEVCVRLPGGLRFVAGTCGVERLANLSEFECRRLVRQMRRVEPDNDFLVLDCGAGISRSVRMFALAAGTIVLVTTPEPAALTDTYATIKVLVRERRAGRIHLLVNMANDHTEARRAYQRIAEVSTKFLKYPIADCGYMLHDNHVELAVRNRSPFVLQFPKCTASSCLMAVASLLDQAPSRDSGSGAILQRAVGLFV